MCGITQRKTETAHARPRLHDLHARRRSLSSIKGTIEFLKKINTSVLECPGNSPDINPVENLWTIMNDQVASKQRPNTENLRQAIKKVWVTEITLEYCKYLVSSMPRRIQTVIDSKVGHTKYRKVVVLTLSDAIMFQMVLYYAFGEIKLYNLVCKNIY